MASRYWVVSLPVQGSTSASSLWIRLQDQISKHSFDTPLYRVTTFFLLLPQISKIWFYSFCNISLTICSVFHFFQFNIPNLRVGTLDSLLSLSDDLLKVIVWFLYFDFYQIYCQFHEHLCGYLVNFCDHLECAVKLLCGRSVSQDPKADWGTRKGFWRREQCFDGWWSTCWFISDKVNHHLYSLLVFSNINFKIWGSIVWIHLRTLSVLLYTEFWRWFGCRFVWDEAKYPTMSPLREIVDGIHSQVAKIEDDLKVMLLSYQTYCFVPFLFFSLICDFIVFHIY